MTTTPASFGAPSPFPRWALPTDVPSTDVASRIARYVQTESEWRQVGADLNALKAKPVRAQAEQADTAAYAEAIQSKAGKDPGTPAVDQLEVRLGELARRKAALAVATNTAATELAGIVAEHRTDLEAKAAAARRTAEAAYLAAVDVLEEKASVLAQARRLEEWSGTFPKGGTRLPWGKPLRLLTVTRLQGEPNSVTVAEALRRALEPPTPPTIGGTALARTAGQLAA